MTTNPRHQAASRRDPYFKPLHIHVAGVPGVLGAPPRQRRQQHVSLGVVTAAAPVIAAGVAVMEIVNQLFPTDADQAKTCLEGGGMWDVDGRACVPLDSQEGKRLTCQYNGDGGTWDPVKLECVMPTNALVAEQGGMGNGTKVLIALGAVAAVAAATAGGLYLYKNNKKKLLALDAIGSVAFPARPKS